jgi:epoxyqueuosine reductase
MSFVSSIEHTIRLQGFDHFGFAPLDRPISMDVYREWLEAGHHADMQYLSDHAGIKENPQRLASRARSAIVIAKPYGETPYAENPFPRALRTALYAKGEDYHLHFKNELEEIAAKLRAEFTGEEFLCFTDSAPILERDLAYRAGLGWFGKNTCLINTERGSLFFLGQILTSLELDVESAKPADHCGTCNRCIEACPTQALTPRQLDANKCISFWTIEAKAEMPEELRVKSGDWFFGCDICQTVCPWNEKVYGREKMRTLADSPSAEEDDLCADLKWVLSSSNREIQRQLIKSPVSRARPLGLKRNALMVIANKKLRQMRPEVEAAQTEPRLRELAEWTLNQLNSQ